MPPSRFDVAASGGVGPCFGEPPLPALPLPGGDDELFSPTSNGDLSPSCCVVGGMGSGGDGLSPTFDKPIMREMEKTIEGTRFVAQHMRNKDKFESVSIATRGKIFRLRSLTAISYMDLKFWKASSSHRMRLPMCWYFISVIHHSFGLRSQTKAINEIWLHFGSEAKFLYSIRNSIKRCHRENNAHAFHIEKWRQKFNYVRSTSCTCTGLEDRSLEASIYCWINREQ